MLPAAVSQRFNLVQSPNFICSVRAPTFSAGLPIPRCCPRALLADRSSASCEPGLRRSNIVACATSGGSEDLAPKSKYLTSPATSSPSSSGVAASGSSAAGFDIPTGVATLVLVNCAIFAAVAAGKSSTLVSYLVISPAKWWTFITSAFMHQSVEQLGRNMFMVFFFSQMVYRELGAIGVWFSYALCGLGANLACWFMLAAGAKAKAAAMLGLASSGGALGICLAAVALSFRPTLAYVLGAALTLNFVSSIMLAAPAATAASTYSAAEAVTAVVSDPVGLAKAAVKGLRSSALDPGNIWVLGAAAGAAVIVLLARLPDPDAKVAR